MKLLSFAADARTGSAWRATTACHAQRQDREPDLRAAFAAGALEAMRRAAKDAAPDRSLNEIKFLPVIPKPGKILCAVSITARMSPKWAVRCPKQPSCLRALPIRWSVTRLNDPACVPHQAGDRA